MAAMIALIVAAFCVASSSATWCHQSAYSFTAPKPTCASLLSNKLALYKACGMTAMKVTGPAQIPAQIPSATTLYYYQVACGGTCDYTIMQVVKDNATWSMYDTCEHSKAAYTRTFAGHSNAACKTDGVCAAPWCHLSGYSFAKPPTCPSLISTKVSLYKACGMTPTLVTGPAKIPGVVVGKNLYYYQVACKGSCAPNSFQLMQVVANSATWSTYDTCEHAQAAYLKTFNGTSSAPCKGDMMCMF